MNVMPTLIFVYGTLKRGYDHPMARHLAENAHWIGAAACCGKLYRIGTYPGLVLSSDMKDIVHGDVFELPGGDGALLAALDDYEGCGANDPHPHPYVRQMIDVTTKDGVRQRAWTYVYQRPVVESSRIADGRFTAASSRS